MRYLVTGGAGFVGSHYVRTLLAGEYDVDPVAVTVLDKFTYAGNAANLTQVADDPRLRVLVGDIADPAACAEAVASHDVVVNFAAETHVDRSIAGPPPFVQTNVVGTQTLLQACVDAGVERVVHVSTDEVYGSIDAGSWAEDAPLLPNSPYAASKAAADLLVRAFWRTYDLNISVTRCCNTYGAYQSPDKLVPLFVTNLLDGSSVPLYGDGKHVRDWVHVADHGRAVQLVLARGEAGGIYNVGGGCELTNLELTRLLLDACGAAEDRIEFVRDRKAHDRRYSVDGSKLADLGYAPTVPFRVGLRETVRWYADHRAWWEPQRPARQ